VIWDRNSTLEDVLKDSDFTSEARLLAGALVAFLLVALLPAVDVFADIGGGDNDLPRRVESGVLVVGLLGSAFMLQQLALVLRRARAVEREADDLKHRLAATEADAALAGRGAGSDEGARRLTGPTV
jgi:hypothetical protein